MVTLPFLPVPAQSFPIFLKSGINIMFKKEKKEEERKENKRLSLIDREIDSINWVQNK